MKVKINYIVLIVFFLILLSPAYTQVTRVIQNQPIKTIEEPDEEETEPDSTDFDLDEDEDPDSAIVIPDDFTSSLDFLLQNWAVDKNVTSNCISQSNPLTDENQYRERLRKLPHLIEMPYNTAVKSFIDIYTQQRRKQVEYLLGLSDYYFPIFESALEAMRLPLELK